MKFIAIIPARYDSSRFPGKPLVEIEGKSMIQRTYEQVLKSKLINEAIVATDDDRIFQHVLSFDGQVRMTDSKHKSGTDRCAEVAATLDQSATVFINVQGDEPFIQPEQIDQLAQLFIDFPEIPIATLARKIDSIQDLENPNIVKVIRSPEKGNGLYFSRQAIPFQRGVPRENWLSNHSYFHHIGIYGFKAKTLLKISQLPISQLEMAEALEQLRWLDYGYTIQVGITPFQSIGIDTPEDLKRLYPKFR